MSRNNSPDRRVRLNTALNTNHLNRATWPIQILFGNQFTLRLYTIPTTNFLTSDALDSH